MFVFSYEGQYLSVKHFELLSVYKGYCNKVIIIYIIIIL